MKQKLSENDLSHEWICITWRLFHPPKYQNSLFTVAPQPEYAVAPSPYSKAKSSLILPE